MWSLPSKVNRPYVLSATKHRAHRRLRPAPAAAADQGFPHQSGQHLGEPGRWRRIPDRAPDFRSSEHDQRSFGSASLGGISLPIGVAILVAAVSGYWSWPWQEESESSSSAKHSTSWSGPGKAAHACTNGTRTRRERLLVTRRRLLVRVRRAPVGTASHPVTVLARCRAHALVRHRTPLPSAQRDS